MATHMFTVKHADYERFMEESRKARVDFDNVKDSQDQRAIEAVLTKYETFIEEHYEPYASMRKFI